MRRIRSGQSGVKLSLFDLEAEIMEIIWEFQHPEFSVGEVVNVLEHRREIAYTTVMTTVVRLYEKGLLSRTKHGRKYLYTAIQSREEYIVQLTKDVIQQLPPIGQETAVSMLIGRIDDADDDALLKLEEMIRQKRLRSGDTNHE
jgi:predicted transcriptional regulator